VSAFIIAILALAIGANAALFGIADRLLLSGPAHVVEPGRVQRLYLTIRPSGMREFTSATVGQVTFDLVQQSGAAFDGVAAYTSGPGSTGRGEGARRAVVGHASASFFPLLGVRPAVGRFFTGREDSAAGAERVAVISHSTWQASFGGSGDAVGRTIVVQDETYVIVGVTPAGFTGVEPGRVDVWLPMNLLGPRITSDWATTWSAQWLKVIVRLAPGGTPEAADAAVTAALRARYSGDEPSMREARAWFGAVSRTEEGTAAAEAVVVRWLWGVALLVLVIAAANVTNLLLARGAGRVREIGVRLALGASRGAVMRMLVVESLVLSLVGAALGWGIAAAIGRTARAVLLDNVEWTAAPAGPRVLLMAAALALATGTIVGLVPALALTRGAAAGALRSTPRDGGSRLQLRAALTVLQAAICVVLLIGAGLFLRSTWQARTLDLGFDARRVLVVETNRGRLAGVPPERRAAERERRNGFLPAVLDEIAALPGVDAASVAVGLPFGNRFSVRTAVPGMAELPRVATGGPSISAVSAGYFETMGRAVLKGRPFTRADRAGSAPVAIISEFMARTVWPGLDPLGRCLEIGPEPAPCSTIIGIAADTHRARLVESPRMHVYVPLGQQPGFGGDVLLIRAADLPAVAGEVRRLLHAADGSITYVAAEPLQARIDPQLRSWELGMTTLLFSGSLALVVAAAGIYSVVSYLVASRRREIGVRLALGAQGAEVVRMVLRWSVGLTGIGVAAGLGVSLLAAPWLEPLLFQVSGRDPAIYAGVAALLLAVAGAASVGPCAAASGVDPIEALRVE
jgi:predicted permease